MMKVLRRSKEKKLVSNFAASLYLSDERRKVSVEDKKYGRKKIEGSGRKPRENFRSVFISCAAYKESSLPSWQILDARLIDCTVLAGEMGFTDN